MRPIAGYPLLLSNAYEVRDPRVIHAAEIAAVIDLALNEPPLAVTRELVYCRFPLLDGSGNPPWLLHAAINTLADLLRAKVRTLVFCSAGLSRSPVIAAAAIARVQGSSIQEVLPAILLGSPADVSPALVAEVELALRNGSAETT